MKRTWIKVKRGLLDPKHRYALGESIYLFLYILDITNWESGVIEEWKDKAVADDLDMPISTLRYQRNQLKEKGYINWEPKQHGLRIVVHNWTNPKEYSGDVYNKRQVANQVNNEVANQVNNEVVKPQAQISAPSYSHISHITHHISNKEGDAQTASPFQVAEKLSTVCRMDLTANKGRLLKAGKILLSIPGFDPELMAKTYAKGGSWYRKDFRGTRGDPPTPEQVVATWKVLTEKQDTAEVSREERLEYLKWSK
jgi:hypothetical protein